MNDLVIVVLGCAAVGKSALSLRFINGVFVDAYDPTVEETYRKNIQVGDDQVSIELYDTAGTEHFESMKDQYFERGDTFLFVYSVEDSKSFEGMKDQYQRFLRTREELGLSRDAFVIACNKCDLNKSGDVVDEGRQFAESLGVPFFLTSAKTGEQVDVAFESAVKAGLVHHKKKLAERPESSTCCTLA